MSSFRLERRPRSTAGKASIQLFFLLQRIAVLRKRCHRSMIPFEEGWYADVLVRWLPIKLVKALNNSDSTLICSNSFWGTESSDPFCKESSDYSIGVDVLDRNCFWPSGESVDHCNAILITLYVR